MTDRTRHQSKVLALAWVLVLACGEDGGAEVTTKRGAPGAPAGDASDAKKSAAPAKRTPAAGGAAAATKPAAGAAAEAEEEEPTTEDSTVPPVALDSKSFARKRDPFMGVVPTEVLVPESAKSRGERRVQMPQYAFEDLTLVAIVNAGRGILPRALFVASDGKSQAIRQGEFFSSAEVLLAAVNRDYVEIEVVDDELAASLQLQRGERRAIYLKHD
jgi:hypothetical protein